MPSISNPPVVMPHRRGRAHDPRTLRLRNYYAADVVPAPLATDWTHGRKHWGDMLNLTLGDCSIAGVGHAVQVWTLNTRGMAEIPDRVIKHYYESWDGYRPGDKATDIGGSELAVLKHWRHGRFEHHQLYAFAQIDPHDVEMAKLAIHHFGGVYVGINLPENAKHQIQKGDPWHLRSQDGPAAHPGSWGGHCIFVPRYDEHYFTGITWGILQSMSVDFWRTYVDEVHVLLSHDWLSHHHAPSGFNVTQLDQDLAAVATMAPPPKLKKG